VPKKARKRLKEVEFGSIWLILSRFFDAIFRKILLMIKELSSHCTKSEAPFLSFWQK